MDEATAFGFVGIKACPPLGYAMKLDTPKLGVLGGMGPLATVDFLAKLIAVTPAEFDQDHIPTIIYSAPYIPDRTANIRGHGPSPLPYMLSGLGFLEQSGVSCIAIPCNTAHFWYDQLSASASVPTFHIADAACDCVAPHTRRAPASESGDGRHLNGRADQQRIETRGFRCLERHSDADDLIMPAIHLIKQETWGPPVRFSSRRECDWPRGEPNGSYGVTEIPIALPAGQLHVDLSIDRSACDIERAGWWK